MSDSLFCGYPMPSCLFCWSCCFERCPRYAAGSTTIIVRLHRCRRCNSYGSICRGRGQRTRNRAVFKYRLNGARLFSAMSLFDSAMHRLSWIGSIHGSTAVSFGPSLVVLDEPTTGLDSETERLIFSAIQQFSRNLTLVVVTHREELARKADYVVRISTEGITVESNKNRVTSVEAH